MKTLTNAHLATHETLCSRLIQAYGELEDSVLAFNAAMEESWKQVGARREAYNMVVEEANTWYGDISGELYRVIQGHSGKWQESSRGHDYIQWQEKYKFTTLEKSELEQPEPLALDIGDQSEDLGGLPEAP